MSYNIVTHTGKAHIDEVMAAALVAVAKSEQPKQVLRLTETELASLDAGETAMDPTDETWFVDCGLEYDPQRRRYDHHQDSDLDSAAMLVFRHLFPELAGSDLDSYFQLLSKVDTRGARSLADVDTISESRDYWSLPHQLLVKTFEERPLAVVDIVSFGLARKIEFEEVKKRASDWVSAPGRLVDRQVDDLTVLEYTEAPPADIVDGLKAIDGEIIDAHQAAVVYGYDKNDPSIRTLYRTDIGHDLVDFTRAAFTNVLFCHQGGFLARFRPDDDQEWKRIVKESVIGQYAV